VCFDSMILWLAWKSNKNPSSTQLLEGFGCLAL
jgi:hypothetical protein